MELLLTLTHCLKRINKALQFVINRVLNEQKKGFSESRMLKERKERIEEGLGRKVYLPTDLAWSFSARVLFLSFLRCRWQIYRTTFP